MRIQRVEHNRRRLHMHVHVCESRLERGRGLLLRRCPDRGTAYLLKQCSAVHTVGMTYAIDIVFCNGTGRILRIVTGLRPFRVARHPDATQVWEVAAGVAAQWGWRVGDEDRAMLTAGGSQRGAATVEFYLVALLALLPLCLGMLQTSLLLVDNHHVDNAAFMAARAGATRQADIGAMRSEFARVISPLFVESAGGVDGGNVAARVASAYLRSTADVAAFARIRVLAPSAAAKRDFGEVRDGATVIPNDALEHRSDAPGSTSGESLQQANMLRVEFIYCRPLVVPFIRGFMLGLLRRLDAEPSHQLCYAAGRTPIRSVGTAPMQSDYLVAGHAG